MNSHPISDDDLPYWLRKGYNKEGTNNTTSRNQQVDGGDDSDEEVDPSDTERSPRLKKIPKMGRLSLILKDDTVLQAPDEDEITVIRKRTVSLGGLAALEGPRGERLIVGEGYGFKRYTRASTYDFGTKPSLYDSQFLTSENGDGEALSIPEFPLPPSTPAAKQLPSSSTTTSLAASTKVSPSASTNSNSTHTPATQLNVEPNSGVVSLVTHSTQTPSTPQRAQSTHSTQTPSPQPCDHSTQTSSALVLCPKPKQAEKVIVVGISGISGSGKSTLAYILNEIFNPETEEEKKSGVRARRIITQDDYFKPKGSCPTMAFVVTGKDDLEFAKMSHITQGVSGIYDIDVLDIKREEAPEEAEEEAEEDENESIDWADFEEGADEGEDQVHKEDGDAEEDEDSYYANLEEDVIDGTYWSSVKSMVITGPDTDCAAAFDFEALEKAVGDLKERGEVVSDTGRKPKGGLLGLVENTDEGVNGHSGIFGSSSGKANRKRSASVAELESGSDAKAQPKNHHVDNITGLNAQYHDLITELRQLVRNSSTKFSEKVRFVFVEGMLLYTNPSSPDDTRIRLQSHLQIPLYLPTFFPVAKSRRLARPIYTDLRQIGQMWKTEAYFDAVVCKNFRDEYAWLDQPLFAPGGNMKATRDNLITNGVYTRANGEWNIEEGVRWAFGKIMYESLCGDI